MAVTTVQYTPVPPISSHTVECDFDGFVEWLNQLAELANYNNKLATDNANKIKELDRRVACLEARVDAIEEDLGVIHNTLDNHESRITNLESVTNRILQDINDILADITYIQEQLGNLNWLLSIMPYNRNNIPSDFRIAVGNINHMSANNGTPSLSIGIFTSSTIEDNDVYDN